MSWDRIEYIEVSSCACGQGRLLRKYYQEDDDWGRSRSGYADETIECPQCRGKYHIEHLVRHFFQHKWDGDGVSDTTYLVENGFSVKHNTEVQKIMLSKLDEEIVATTIKDDIVAVIAEMKEVKYSTRLHSPNAQRIAALYFKRYKVKALPEIINFLQGCVDRYESYKWNTSTMATYLESENERVEKNQSLLNEALKHAVPVSWTRISESNNGK